MLSFTVIRLSKSDRYVVYNAYGNDVAYCTSMQAVFNYFYSWRDKLGQKHVKFFDTASKDVILVIMD